MLFRSQPSPFSLPPACPSQQQDTQPAICSQDAEQEHTPSQPPPSPCSSQQPPRAAAAAAQPSPGSPPPATPLSQQQTQPAVDSQLPYSLLADDEILAPPRVSRSNESWSDDRVKQHMLRYAAGVVEQEQQHDSEHDDDVDSLSVIKAARMAVAARRAAEQAAAADTPAG